MTFAFGTKAETLEQLRAHLHSATLLEQLAFTVADWNRDHAGIVARICTRFANQALAIRSSAKDEDGWASSKAGVYRSLTRVTPEPAFVSEAVQQVISSYNSSDSAHQILVQPMVENVIISGVVLSRDLDTLSPYYSINYDDFSGRTDTVTSGVVNKAMLVLRSRPEALRSPRFRNLINLVRRIEGATGYDELDIEFCITADGNVVLLQVRPLTITTDARRGPVGRFGETLDAIHNQLREFMRPSPGLLGETTLFGEMPDWNPAEMIGSAPRPLALSIYRYLITDRIWRQSRERMGYRKVPEVPLLVALAGRPFVDVRASLNSFLPAGIDEAFGARLIAWQINRLIEHPEWHDKIEFEVAITCRDFDFQRRADQLREAGFADGEIAAFEAQLGRLTRGAIEDHVSRHRELENQVRELANRRERASRLPGLECVRALLDDCRDFGTLPFADLARHAFIGISLLKSLVARGVFSSDDADRFLRSFQTVAGKMLHDMHELVSNRVSMDSFLQVYGHLRPGTYDILSWRYDERPDLYLGHGEVPSIAPEPFTLSATQRSAIEALLAEFGYRLSPEDLLDYIASAVRLREWAKFHFSHNISDALEALTRWGEPEQLTRDDLSYLDIVTLLSSPVRAELNEMLPAARERHGVTRAVRLPHLITGPEDAYVVRLPLGQPNFITHKSVTARATNLRTGEFPEIDGTIVVTESADPGFDWIFSHPIMGLVTKFGGANSHMAIRCAEFGLPAAIGCGERAFSTLSKAKVIELNAGHRTVRAVR